VISEAEFDHMIFQQHQSLLQRYPKLQGCVKKGNGYYISGILDLVDPETRHIWDTYPITISIKNDYPKTVPSLFVDKTKITRTDKNHINNDGSCCLSPKVEEKLILGRSYNLLDYVDKLVVKFLAAHKLRALGLDWINGEYSHYAEGLVEYYSLKLRTTDLDIILNSLKVLSGYKRFNGYQFCYCESGDRFKTCHNGILEIFRDVEPEYFRSDLFHIIQYLKDNGYQA
jgi:hypothetical protein